MAMRYGDKATAQGFGYRLAEWFNRWPQAKSRLEMAAYVSRLKVLAGEDQLPAMYAWRELFSPLSDAITEGVHSFGPHTFRPLIVVSGTKSSSELREALSWLLTLAARGELWRLRQCENKDCGRVFAATKKNHPYCPNCHADRIPQKKSNAIRQARHRHQPSRLRGELDHTRILPLKTKNTGQFGLLRGLSSVQEACNVVSKTLNLNDLQLNSR